MQTPHPDRSVRVAALDCLSKLGNREAIAVIDSFVEETSPSGDVLREARHAKAVLLDRKDVALREILADIFPDESPVFALEVDYHDVFGVKLQRVARALGQAMEQYHSNHWDDFITKLDGVCDLIVRHIYDKHAELLGLDDTRAHAMAQQDYGNRLSMSQFKNTFSAVQPLLEAIHAMRNEATTTHVEDRDGAEKPGVGPDEGALCLEQFRALFPKIVTAINVAKR